MPTPNQRSILPCASDVEAEVSIPKAWASRIHLQTLVPMAATALGLYLYVCYRLAPQFLPALVWALALAVLLTPLQWWREGKIKSPSLATVVCVLVIGLILVVPATFVGQRLVVRAARGAQHIEAEVNSGAVLLEVWPRRTASMSARTEGPDL